MNEYEYVYHGFSPQPPPVWHDWQGPMGGMWPGHWGYTPTLLQEVPWEF